MLLVAETVNETYRQVTSAADKITIFSFEEPLLGPNFACPPVSTASGDSVDEATYQKERAAFFSMLPTLRAYEGTFVAVHGERVVDSDRSRRELTRRFFERFGDVAVYIDFVGPAQVVRVPTPLFKRSPGT